MALLCVIINLQPQPRRSLPPSLPVEAPVDDHFDDGTASTDNNGVGAVDCDSRRVVGPTKTIRGVCWTQLNRLRGLPVLPALREWSF